MPRLVRGIFTPPESGAEFGQRVQAAGSALGRALALACGLAALAGRGLALGGGLLALLALDDHGLRLDLDARRLDLGDDLLGIGQQRRRPTGSRGRRP